MLLESVVAAFTAESKRMAKHSCMFLLIMMLQGEASYPIFGVHVELKSLFCNVDILLIYVGITSIGMAV